MARESADWTESGCIPIENLKKELVDFKRGKKVLEEEEAVKCASGGSEDFLLSGPTVVEQLGARSIHRCQQNSAESALIR